MALRRLLHVALTITLVVAIGSCLSVDQYGLLKPPLALAAGFSYEGYAKTLSAHVDGQGKVNYRGLKADRKGLDAFVSSLAALEPEVFSKWSDKEKIAFWINAYNALTLRVIIDNYPIKASFFSALRFPQNSIRQIKGVWDEIQFPVMERNMTVDNIEHDTLRSQFDDPRIHMALVCAALGCPPLRNEPYTANKLDSQLDDQARRFFQDPEKFRVDRGEGRIYLSSIFKWFGGDFVKAYGSDKRFPGKGETERAVLNFASKYLDRDENSYLEEGGYSISYLPYDWSLNEKQ
jgi:Protein of unknown function, DUF547